MLSGSSRRASNGIMQHVFTNRGACTLLVLNPSCVVNSLNHFISLRFRTCAVRPVVVLSCIIVSLKPGRFLLSSLTQ
jgi:hypothetical protein